MLLLVGLAAAGGCGLDLRYLVPAAAGQMRILIRSVPISKAIESDDLTAEQKAKLELIRDVRTYAHDVIGLNIDRNFNRFYNAGGGPVAFNVSASNKDAFVPRTWRFPVVGTVPYLGFFNRAAADARFARLADEGLDVFMYEIDAYSGLGFFPNLVLSPMLRRANVGIVDTIIHELLHSTIWRANDTSFNESLATFFGRTGTVAYFRDRYPEQPETVLEAIESFEDADRYSDAMMALYDELDVFYESDRTSESRILGREEIYQAGRDRFVAEVQPLMHHPQQYDWAGNFPTNNAWMLGFRRYNSDLDVFAGVFAAVGQEWSTAVAVFQAATDDPDPYSYLRSWLDVHEAGEPPAGGVTDSAHAVPRPGTSDAASQPASRGPCNLSESTTILRPD